MLQLVVGVVGEHQGLCVPDPKFTSLCTSQKAFLNNFENVVNQGVDMREDIRRYQETLSYASSNEQ